MPVEVERGQGRAVVRIVGTFEREDARVIRELLDAEPDTALRIDMQETRGCEPVALASLASDLRERPERVEVLGICWYQRRLLSYVGVPDAVDVAIAASASED